MSVIVSVDRFEGPLGLLLYLIRKEEMDIYNIPIHRITQQYLEHIKSLKNLNLEAAGEFVSMAATLIYIKSRMLLPTYNEEGEVVEEEDPRKELVKKLLEYERFQEASTELYKRPLLNRDQFHRGATEDLEKIPGEIILDENGLYALIGLYRDVIRQYGRSVHKVVHKTKSIASRILELRDVLIPGRRTTLKEVLPVAPLKSELVITFMAILELGKLGFIRLFQNEVFGELHIATEKPIDRNVIERVDDYDYKESPFDSPAESTDEIADSEPQQLSLYPHDAEDIQDEVATDEEIDAAELELEEGFLKELENENRGALESVDGVPIAGENVTSIINSDVENFENEEDDSKAAKDEPSSSGDLEI